jgi:putative ABC transport system permease protein
MADLSNAWRRYQRFWGPRLTDDVDAELRFHVEMRELDYAARGFAGEDARNAAIRRLGDIEAARSQCVTIATRRERRMHRTRVVNAFRQDVFFAARTLWRQRAWTSVVTLTLALGLGASTAVFSVINTLVLHPLPYRDAKHVVIPWRSDAAGSSLVMPSTTLVEAWRSHASSLEGIEPFRASEVTRATAGEPELWHAASVRPSFAHFVGARILIGRNFAPSDTTDDAGVAMLSEAAWRRRFGAADDVVGKTLSLDQKRYVVIGITSRDMRLPDLNQQSVDVWLPLARDTFEMGAGSVARLRAGVRTETAQKEMEAIAARVSSERSTIGAQFAKIKLGRPGVSFRQSLVIIAVGVGLLLLIACANVAHLLLARSTTRKRELAIRAALGAGRGRLLRQLVTESLVLTAVGLVVGLAFAAIGVRALLANQPAGFEPLSLVSLDGRALAVATAVALVTGLVFGSLGASHAARNRVADVLKGGAGSNEPERQRAHSILVVTEMALSAMLLVGATLLVRTVVNLQRVDPGFVPRGLYTLRFDRPRTACKTIPECDALGAELLRRARLLPGVTAATLATEGIPQQTGYLLGPWQVFGHPRSLEGSDVTAINHVRPDFFATIGLHLIEGRGFDAGAADRNEIVISQSLAKRLWPHESAIGKQLRHSGTSDSTAAMWRTVVGIMPNLPVLGLASDAGWFVAFLPARRGGTTVLVRARPDADPSLDLRRLARTLGGDLALPRITNVDRALSDSVATQRFAMVLLAAVAGLAVLFSAVGLYGIISFLVARRTREIGIRVALGGTRWDITTLVVGRALVLCVVGLGIGLVGARWGTGLIESMLYGVGRADTTSYALDATLLIGVACVASLVPLRRALRVDPLIAIRAD